MALWRAKDKPPVELVVANLALYKGIKYNIQPVTPVPFYPIGSDSIM